MKELSVYAPDGEEKLAALLRGKLNDPVFLCIGTEKVFSDSLGPKVGTLLNENMRKPCFVYGLRGQNVTAENLCHCCEFVRKVHPDSQIVVVDAAVGSREQIGHVQISDGGIVPGAATNKNLPSVGDVGIIGIVADRGMEDFYTLNSSKERFVNQVAQFIAKSIISSQQDS